MIPQEIMKQLQAPFEPSEIEWRVGSTNADKTKGMALAYVTNRAIQDRLDNVFGCFGWQNEFREWKKEGQICGISVLYEGKWITKWDGADDSNMEATKGGLSDAMKRAAYQWGIGRYLYKLPSVWVDIEARGKSYVIKQTPSLPKWALPNGYAANTPPQPSTPAQQPATPEAAQPASKPDSMTDKQRGKMMATMRDKHITKEQVVDYIGFNFGKESTKELTLAESSQLIEWLEAKEAAV